MRTPRAGFKVIAASSLVLVLLFVYLYSKVSKPSHHVDPRLVSAVNSFAFELFAEMLKQDQGTNMVVSPASLSSALTVAYRGAAGETKEDLARTLGLEALRVEAVDRGMVGLRSTLQDPGSKVRLALATSLWAREGIRFKPEFVSKSKTSYGAEVATLDFADPHAASRVNSWVKRNTQGRIKQVVDRFEERDVLLLVNAIYFKGAWANKFDKAGTCPREFYLADGSKKLHPTMSQSSEYEYYLHVGRENGFEALRLAYGRGAVAMYIFVPAPWSDLETFCGMLNATNWGQWMRQFRKEKVHVWLPRFKLSYQAHLKPALEALGMGAAFDPDRADFRNMCYVTARNNVWLARIAQKALVEVNEEGTEAAAASYGLFGARAGPRMFKANRPFFFAIRDDRTGAILFMGTIVDPKVE